MLAFMSSPEVNPTRRSLLSRLRNWDDQQSWQEFFDAYWKLIYHVAVKMGLNDAEAQDVVQETVIAVAKKMPEFKYDPAMGSFKNWLLLITRRRITDFLRKQGRRLECVPQPRDPATGTGVMDGVPDPRGMDLEALWEREWEQNITEAAIQRVKNKVAPRQFQIFDCHVLKQWPVSDVTKALGVTAGQVYLAKHRIAALIKREVEWLETQKT
jgi:RNA polymerase sigma factor (sigma-70 family)